MSSSQNTSQWHTNGIPNDFLYTNRLWYRTNSNFVINDGQHVPISGGYESGLYSTPNIAMQTTSFINYSYNYERLQQSTNTINYQTSNVWSNTIRSQTIPTYLQSSLTTSVTETKPIITTNVKHQSKLSSKKSSTRVKTAPKHKPIFGQYICICNNPLCKVITMHRIELMDDHTIKIPHSARTVIANSFEKSSTSMRSTNYCDWIRLDHFAIEDRYSLRKKPGRPRRVHDNSQQTISPLLTIEERQRELFFLQSIKKQSPGLFSSIEKAVNGQSTDIINASELERIFTTTKAKPDAKITFPLSTTVAPSSTGNNDTTFLPTIGYDYDDDDTSTSILKLTSSTSVSVMPILPGRWVAERILQCIKKPIKLTKTISNSSDYLYTYIDMQSCINSYNNCPNKITCSIDYSIWSRREHARPENFDGKRSIRLTVESDPHKLQNTLIPFNEAPRRRGQSWEKVLKNDNVTILSKKPNFQDAIYCNGMKVVDIEGVWACQKTNSGVKFYLDTKGILPLAQCFPLHAKFVYYYLPLDLLTHAEINNTIIKCSMYNPNIIPVALLLLLRFADKKKLVEMQDLATRKQDEGIFTNDAYRTQKERLLLFLRRLLSAFVNEMNQLVLTDLDRLPWSKWPHVLEDGDQYFDEETVVDRVATRNIATRDASSKNEATMILKSLHQLHTARILLHSQKR